MTVRRLACFATVCALGACSSEPIATGANAGGGAGAPGSAGGGGGSGGGGAGTPPDYTQSACYGRQATTQVYDLETHGTSTVTATCRAEGARARLYVADDLWQTKVSPDAPALDQPEIDAFMRSYELVGQAASAHPELGVLPTDEAVFGALPEASLTDGKLPIFVIDSRGAGDGYLCSWCAQPALHLDGPSLRSLHTDTTLSIAAHESFHAIHRAYDADEEVWVDETLAEAAMTVNGFFTDRAWLEEFLQTTNQAWGPGVNDARSFDYGAGLLFGTYLWEHGGAPLLAAITHEPANGWTGLDRALATTGSSATGWELFQDMAVAVVVNDPSTGYGFQSIALEASVLPYAVKTGATLTETIEPYGVIYVRFEADATSVTLDAPTAVSARLVLEGDALEVREIAPGSRATFDGKTPRSLVLTARETTAISVTAR